MGYEQLSLDLPALDAGLSNGGNHGSGSAQDAGKKKEKPADASLRFIPSSMNNSRRKPAVPPKPPNRKPVFHTTSHEMTRNETLSSDHTSHDGAAGVGGQKRGHSLEDWTARAEESQYHLRDYQRPRYSKKQRKEYEREAQEARLSSFNVPYEVAHPTAFGSFRRSDAHKTLNQWWRDHIREAELQHRDRDSSTSTGSEDHDSKYRPRRLSSSSFGSRQDRHVPSVDVLPHDTHTSSPQPAPQQTDVERERLMQRERAIANMRAQAAAAKQNISNSAEAESGATPPSQPQTLSAESLSTKHVPNTVPQGEPAGAGKHHNANPSEDDPTTPYTLSKHNPPTFVPTNQPSSDGRTGLGANSWKPSSSVIASAPAMLYNRPPPNVDDQDMDLDQQAAPPRGKTPPPAKKERFGSRLLQKHGWQQGQGLGVDGEGIKRAIVAKVDKRKKLPDSRGGGFATPANMGRIVGGAKPRKPTAAAAADQSKVVRISNMLTGLDVADEIENNNLLQEIGEYMGEYGNVERLFIDRAGTNDVFVKFNSELSAIRAKNATDGTEFGENKMVVVLWDEEKFEAGEYA